MEKPSDISSGVMASIEPAYSACYNLRNTLTGSSSNPCRVRPFLNELECLIKTLELLRTAVNSMPKIEISELSGPLDECGRACKSFQQQYQYSHQISTEDLHNLRGFPGTIDNLTQLLNGYNSTFKIVADTIRWVITF
ncbi:hypothetical protein BDV33DRAFT_52519 [Aspergillus novoparasiticus]|uniref:Azaphilone pigments biosynthesis cluster protein L N-terminal domain-containing protein n=1 Tax=Aspergillus novoparasiticus TaxID=986946 RepID=A0A5N6E7R3_9EURO|nr:hypothetical protein BDV33DRAFT_52519 [Aspergillus novoparasiticus]